MHKEHNNDQQIEDIVDVEDSIISMEKIDFLANNQKAIERYESQYKSCYIRLF